MKEKTYHTAFNTEMIEAAKTAILPGDPGRVEKIAGYLDFPKKVTQNREYTSYLGYIDDRPVLVMSTGMGGPSAAIGVEELHMCGVEKIIRIGSCGGMQDNVRAGDIVIAQAAVRQDGTSREYAPIELPAVADFDITTALRAAAEENGYNYHIGTVQCKDSFYGQHSPEASPVYYELKQKWESWKRLGVKASEMESAALFVVAAALGCRCGSCFHVIWNQEREKAGLDQDMSEDTSAAVKVAVEALKLVIERDRKG